MCIRDRGKVDQVAAFVTRRYEKLLGRSPDLSGKGTWVTELKSGRMGGADVASGFVTSVELKNRNLDDETYVGLLYETFICLLYTSGLVMLPFF